MSLLFQNISENESSIWDEKTKKIIVIFLLIRFIL